MKQLILAGLALALIVTGCSTPQRVATLEGRGTKQTFDASYEAVWRAAVDASQQGELEILNADRSRGFISARRGVQVETFGEHVGVWVRNLGPSSTQVEVVSRQTGPPVMWLKNWENEIIRAIAANLTRDAVGGLGTGSTIQQGSTTVVPAPVPNTTVIVPSPTPAPNTTIEVRDTQRRLEELRRLQNEREAALRDEQNERRRQEIRAEIERLRRELEIQQQRLSDLERDLRR
ncbi:MAG: hypothetical protein L0Y58_14475 [Verrucomicrobia subdivision 3 bacterium]|nr:hypothetical protein [Limisphaerales bacterium]